MDAFGGNYIAKELNLILMKSVFLQFGEQQEFLKLFQNPLYNCDVAVFVIIGVDKYVVQIHNDRDIKFLS